MSPRPSLIPEPENSTLQSTSLASTDNNNQQQNSSNTSQQQQKQNQQNNNQSNVNKQDPTKPPSRSGACRVCLKSFKPDDFSKTCFECQQRVCDDCASYSKLDPDEDPVSRLSFYSTSNRY